MEMPQTIKFIIFVEGNDYSVNKNMYAKDWIGFDGFNLIENLCSDLS